MDIFSIFFNMKVCCVFSLESPRRSIALTVQKRKPSEIIPNIIMSVAMRFFLRD